MNTDDVAGCGVPTQCLSPSLTPVDWHSGTNAPGATQKLALASHCDEIGHELLLAFKQICAKLTTSIFVGHLFMMRSSFTAMALALGMLPAIAQVPASLAAGPRVAVSAVTQPLPTQPQYTRVDQPILRDLVRERSGGRIEVTLATHAERNLAGNEIVRLVRSGQVDIGAGTLSTLSGDVPILDGIDLAGLAPDITNARRIADDMMAVANRDLERFNTRLVATYPFPAQVLFCRQPFTSLADLRGRRIRTFGNSLVDFFTAIGAQPTSIGFPEVYSALERGVVDCAITGSGSGAAARWPEVSTHISNLPLSWAVAGYMVNLQWWNRLAPEVRAFLEATMKQVADGNGRWVWRPRGTASTATSASLPNAGFTPWPQGR